MNAMRSSCLVALVALASLGGIRSAEAHPIVTYPNGQEAVAPGTQLTVSWFYLMDHGAGPVNIYLSTDGGTTWGNPIATANWPDVDATFTVPNIPGTMNKVRVEYIPDSSGGTDYPDDSDDVFCISDPAVSAKNLYIGAQMYFQVQAPSWPNGTAVIFANTTGFTGVPMNLPGGVSVDLVPDVWTLILLSIPAMTIVPLDSGGMGTSQPALIPNNPQLSGVWTWGLAMAVLPQSGWPFVATSCTVTPTVL